MTIPQSVAETILVACSRHCCVCRRFRPLLLQVHHIRERSSGGSDDPDNLIATCISCHAEIHTETKLTRRFTASELKKHRDEVYRLVAEGKLPASPQHDDRIELLTAELLGSIRSPSVVPVPAQPELLPEAIQVICAAANGNGTINAVRYDGGFAVLAGEHNLSFPDEPRKTAALRRAIQQLDELGLVDGDGELYYLSHNGYRLADNLLSIASLNAGRS